MIHEAPLDLPVAVQVDQAVIEANQARPAPPQPLPPADPEHVRALEAAFEARDRESHTVAGLLGMYTGAMLLHDVILDTVTKPAGEVEDDEEEEGLPEA
jgi:hypothetical protein